MSKKKNCNNEEELKECECTCTEDCMCEEDCNCGEECNCSCEETCLDDERELLG